MLISQRLALERFAITVVDGIKNNIRNERVTPFGAVNTTGSAAESIFYRITDDRLIIGSTWAYITVLEDGRKPGKFAPPEVILRWVEQKPITSDISKKSLAFLINRKLKEKGSLIYQQGGKSGILSDYLNDEYIQRFLRKEFMDATIKEVTNLLFQAA